MAKFKAISNMNLLFSLGITAELDGDLENSYEVLRMGVSTRSVSIKAAHGQQKNSPSLHVKNTD